MESLYLLDAWWRSLIFAFYKVKIVAKVEMGDNMKKFFIIIMTYLTVPFVLIFGLFLVGIVGFGIASGSFFNSRIDKDQMSKIFIEDYELLSTVAQFLVDSGYRNVSIQKNMNESEPFIDVRNSEIDVKEIMDAIEELMNRGYSIIVRNGNTINFVRWSSMDVGIGIAYLVEGGEPVIDFLTKFESLSKPNWYYYEEDFNEWRVRNRRSNH